VKLSLKKLALSAGLVGAFAGAVMMAAPAGAVPAASSPGAVLNAVGSDTIYWVSNGLHGAYNTDSTFNTESPKDRLINTTPVVTAPFPAGTVVPPDSNCGEQVYDASNLPPNGSSAGIAALNADGSNGCIDLARSSRGQKTSDPSADQFYAFAVDAVGIGKFTGTHMPSSLTQNDLINIYTCDPATHAPYISDWSSAMLNIPGTAGAIHKYAPQTQAGTYSFFNSKVLNGGTIDSNCDAGHSSTFLEEHDARGVSAANKPGAIIPFSFAQWTADSKGVTPDLRNGVSFEPANVSGTVIKLTAATVNEVAPAGGQHYPYVRYVFNVLNTNEPNWSDTMRYAGVDNSGAGWLCGGPAIASTIIKLYGFVPLKKAATGGGVAISSFCRLNPAAL
jgi:hypothetical protein